MSHIQVMVPATTANLGPGFDTLGLALDLWNRFEATLTPPERRSLAEHPLRPDTVRLKQVTCTGEGADDLSCASDNLVYQGVLTALGAGEGAPSDDARDDEADAWGLHLVIDNQVPLSSGLGSSATAIVAGLLIGNQLRRQSLYPSQLLDLAFDMEGHPDNVAAALLGGLTVCVINQDGRVDALSVPPPEDLWVIVAVPDFYLGTKDSRGALPDRVSRSDAVFNLSRAALWVAAATTGRLDVLRTATEDRLHQPYRSSLIPGLNDVFAEALSAGALGVALSGSGPSVVAFAVKEETRRIEAAMRAAFRRVGVTPRLYTLRPTARGARVEVDDGLDLLLRGVSKPQVAGGR